MGLDLHPQAQNQPDGLLRRISNTRRRIESFGETPTHLQIDGLGKVLAMEVQEAYRQALMREAEKFGVIARGPLDEFTKSSLATYAQGQATKIVSTYMRMQSVARAQGQDLKAWRSNYADWKSKQIMSHEYARADGMAVQDFYTRSRNPDGGLLTAQARVEPLECKTADDCQLWVSFGWVSIDQILDKFLPRHPNCPHHWLVDAGQDRIENGIILPNLPPTPDTTIWLPNTMNLMPPKPSSGIDYHPKTLLATLFLAGMAAFLAARR